MCCKAACTKEGEEKYYSIDKIHNMCGECCMNPSDFLKYKLFEPGLKKATIDNMCDGLNYTEYKETETHGFGNIKMTVDLYKKHPKFGLPSPKSVPLFIAGLMDGFVEENDLSEIEGCYNGGKPLEADIAAAIQDAENKDFAGAIAKLEAVAAAVPAELSTCKSIITDVAAVAIWAKSINKEKVAKNLLLHRGKVEADVTTIKNDFTAGKYFDAGKAAADALELVAGPVHPKHHYNNVWADLPQPKSVGLFVAGLLDEFVESNKLSEIEACYNGGKPLEADLMEALKDVENKDFAGAIAKV